jgi:simple sugar transport system ATP-binding protein
LILGEQRRPPLKRNFFLHQGAIHERARELIRDFDIIPPRPDIQARYLSGGNQQKLVVAREMTARPLRLLIASQPTRGLDVGATEFIHRKLRELRDGGVAVLLLSADLDEVRLLSSRIAVMFRGEVVANRLKAAYREAELGALMLRGRQPEETAPGAVIVGREARRGWEADEYPG